MTKLPSLLLVGIAVMFYSNEVRAQQAASDAEGVIAAADQNQQLSQNQLVEAQQQPNTPPPAQRAQSEVTRTARRFNLGVQGGAGLDPELVDVGVHGQFGPIFTENFAFRPVFEVGAGELTTMLGINLDVLYTFGASGRDTRWTPYVGAGPQFGLSHMGFETDDLSNIDVDGVTIVDNRTDNTPNRFDLGHTYYTGGMNSIVAINIKPGAYFEMKATAWGVSTIRLLAGFNFYGRSPQ